MKRTIKLLSCIAFLAVGAFGLQSCGVATLYYWGSDTGMTVNGATPYEALTYKDYKSQTPQTVCALLCMYQKMVTKYNASTSDSKPGTRGVPAPGICAEYGYMLLQPDVAQTFSQYATPEQKSALGMSDYANTFPVLGKQMIRKEVELYPESASFLKPYLN
jgi:hypothetical protein